jgi:hypothetical protein
MGPTIRAEDQFPFRAACRRFLVVTWRSFEEPEIFVADEDAGPEGATRKGLAIGAVADADALRIDFGFETNGSAMTTSVD